MRSLLIAASIMVFLGCSSVQTDHELTERIIQLIQNEPERWLTVETLRNVTYDYESDDGEEKITLSIRKMSPSTAVMYFPYKVVFSLDSSVKIESQFKSRRVSKSLESFS